MCPHLDTQMDLIYNMNQTDKQNVRTTQCCIQKYILQNVSVFQDMKLWP